MFMYCDYMIHEGDGEKKNINVTMFQLNTDNVCHYISDGPFSCLHLKDLLYFKKVVVSCTFKKYFLSEKVL